MKNFIELHHVNEDIFNTMEKLIALKTSVSAFVKMPTEETTEDLIKGIMEIENKIDVLKQSITVLAQSVVEVASDEPVIQSEQSDNGYKIRG